MESRDTRARIPRLRPELDAIPVQIDDATHVVLRDPTGYSDRMIRLWPEAWVLLLLFDGKRSAEDLSREGELQYQVKVPAAQIAGLAEALSMGGFLDDEHFATIREECDAAWRSLKKRPAVHAGQSYPEDPTQLGMFLSALYDTDETDIPTSPPLGVITPHIDLQVGPEVYVPAIRALAAAEFDTVVILGTSHYASDHVAILTDKDFETPLGLVETDVELVERIHLEAGGRLTHDDRAHRPEHSIEFPVLFLQRYLQGRDFRILPVLCTSLEEHLLDGSSPRDNPTYTCFLDAFTRAVRALGRRVVFLMSVDWSHVGIKFGDEERAQDLLDSVRESDRAQLEALERGDHAAFELLLRGTGNATRIDGYSCITMFFDLAHPARGRLLAYDQWHEEARESGVTYAGMAFYADGVA